MRLYGDADDGLRLDPRVCDIKGEKKYENCNCSIEEENACRTSEYKCVERKCRNSVCSKFACAVTPASQPGAASCECGGGGVSCTQYACENPKCGGRVCVAWSVAPCQTCPPKEGEPGGPACSARCSVDKDCGGYQVSKTETVSNDAGTCSVTCNIECSTTPIPCPSGSIDPDCPIGQTSKLTGSYSGDDPCYTCKGPCDDAYCGVDCNIAITSQASCGTAGTYESCSNSPCCGGKCVAPKDDNCTLKFPLSCLPSGKWACMNGTSSTKPCP